MTSFIASLRHLLLLCGISLDDAEIVDVDTRRPCTVAMVVVAGLMCAIETIFIMQDAVSHGGAGLLWGLLSLLLALVVGLVFLARSAYPEYVFALSCLLVLAFPFDSILSTMALSSLLARRAGRKHSLTAVLLATAVAVTAQLRDTFQPLNDSVWALWFAKPRADTSRDPIVLTSGMATIRATAVVAALLSVLVAALIGLHIRSRAQLRTTALKADAAQTHADSLRTDLSRQQLSDAIAVEAHDTLAHTLSLVAMNANALTIQTRKLADLARTTNDGDGLDAGTLRQLADSANKESQRIRSQAAQAVDEAHTVIDMLRDPQAAVEALAAGDDTSLSRASLQELLASSTDAGAKLSTWIDIQQLSDLNDSIGKVAYRAIQEGLTNARKHAAGAPVSLEVTARPETGVHVHLSNPVVPAGTDAPAREPRGGAGLPGLERRAHAAGGNCRYGVDERGLFHLDVSLPWIAQ